MLGCASYCKDHKSATYSKVKGRMLVCGANILYQKYTRYHWFCDGLRRFYNNYENKIYTCLKCKPFHPNSDMLRLTNRFL